MSWFSEVRFDTPPHDTESPGTEIGPGVLVERRTVLWLPVALLAAWPFRRARAQEPAPPRPLPPHRLRPARGCLAAPGRGPGGRRAAERGRLPGARRRALPRARPGLRHRPRAPSQAAARHPPDRPEAGRRAALPRSPQLQRRLARARGRDPGAQLRDRRPGTGAAQGPGLRDPRDGDVLLGPGRVSSLSRRRDNVHDLRAARTVAASSTCSRSSATAARTTCRSMASRWTPRSASTGRAGGRASLDRSPSTYSSSSANGRS